MEPRSFCFYQPNALPLGQTGSHNPMKSVTARVVHFGASVMHSALIPLTFFLHSQHFPNPRCTGLVHLLNSCICFCFCFNLFFIVFRDSHCHYHYCHRLGQTRHSPLQSLNVFSSLLSVPSPEISIIKRITSSVVKRHTAILARRSDTR